MRKAPMRKSKISLNRNSRRRGATLLEFAITVPLLFFFLFALLEFSRANLIRHSIQLAAYEGARKAIVPGATAGTARTAAFQILNAVGVINADVTVSPAVITPLTPEVTVTIEVSLDDNVWVVPKFVRGKRLTNSVTLSRERSELIAF